MNSYIDIKHLVSQCPRIKISVVTETYPHDVNGVAHTLSKIVDGLVDRGHAITLIRPRHSKDETPHQNQGFQEKLVKGLPIPFYKHLKMGLPSKRELIRLWSFDRPDIVHIATEGPLGWSALQAAKKLRLPVSTDFRTNFHAYSTHYKIGWLSSAILAYLKKFHNSASLTLVPTRQLQNELSGYGFINLKIIPRGIDTHQFNPRKRNLELRKAWGANEATKVLIYVGRLAAEKNLTTIFDAYHSAKRIEPNTKLVLVGDGPLRDELMAEHPEVIFSGFQKGRELAEHYASGDIFLFASQTETFGNVTTEAMAAGVPVVASDERLPRALHGRRDGVRFRFPQGRFKQKFVGMFQQSGSECFMDLDGAAYDLVGKLIDKSCRHGRNIRKLPFLHLILGNTDLLALLIRQHQQHTLFP